MTIPVLYLNYFVNIHHQFNVQGVKGRCELTTAHNYDYIENCMQDITHTLKGIVKKAIQMITGKRAVTKEPKKRKKKKKEGNVEAPDPPPTDEAELIAATVELQLLFRRKLKQQRRADRKYRRLPLPPSSIRRSVLPFAHAGTMNINDWQRYLRKRGPGGYHLAASDLPDAQLQTMIDLMGAIDYLLRPEIDLAEFAAYRVEWLEILARVERDMPAPEGQSGINHALIHVWDQVEAWGPLWAHWTYIFERFLARMTRKITNRAGTVFLDYIMTIS
jgi:hypothetical protein